jgi:hypothetical protein
LSDPNTIIKYMFDSDMLVSASGDSSPALDGTVPLERLEAQICELAGHLAAATCRFLVLLGDFDARRGEADARLGGLDPARTAGRPDDPAPGPRDR